MPQHRKFQIFVGAAILLVLGISLIGYAAGPGRWRQRVLFFPRVIDAGIQGETRFLPVRGDIEADTRLVLEELILGPANLRLSNIVPLGTELRLFMVRDDRVFIDLSTDVVLDRANVRTSLQEAVALMVRTLQFNFPVLGDIEITVGGQVPGYPYFRGEETGRL